MLWFAALILWWRNSTRVDRPPSVRWVLWSREVSFFFFSKCVFLFAAEALRRWSHFNRHTKEALLQKTLSTFFCFLLWHRSQRQKVSITASPSSSSSLSNIILCLHSWSSAELAARNITSSRLFGLITRKQSQSSVTDNLCHVFCELSPMHSAASIVASINRYLSRWGVPLPYSDLTCIAPPTPCNVLHVLLPYCTGQWADLVRKPPSQRKGALALHLRKCHWVLGVRPAVPNTEEIFRQKGLHWGCLPYVIHTNTHILSSLSSTSHDRILLPSGRPVTFGFTQKLIAPSGTIDASPCLPEVPSAAETWLR